MKTKVGGVINRIYPNSSVVSIKRFEKGLINKTYDVKIDGKSLVLRIYPKEFWKVKKEKHLYGLIRKKTSVPVPEVIESGRDYLLMSKVEGKELSVRDKKLVGRAGELLAKIHAIKFPYYGWIINKEIRPRFKAWSDFIYHDLNSKFRKIPAKYAYLKNKIIKIVTENESLLDVKTKPCLLHKDYHSSHIIVGKDKINGIIDIEWAMSGHNELDIVKSISWMFDKKPELERVFLKGYKKYGTISKDFVKRKKLYKLLIMLSALSFSYDCKNKKWCMHNLERLRVVVNEYNKAD